MRGCCDGNTPPQTQSGAAGCGVYEISCVGDVSIHKGSSFRLLLTLLCLCFVSQLAKTRDADDEGWQDVAEEVIPSA